MKTNNNIERRLSQGVEYRAEGHVVRGYGSVFNSKTDIGPFTEEVRAGAFDEVLSNQDVVFVFQHDPSNIMARSTSGTLKYGVDERGLWYEVTLPDTSMGRDMQVLLERGDISANSFAFTVEDEEVTRGNGKPHRAITKVRSLHDISLVTHPAYKDAVVISRSALDQCAEEPIRKRYKKGLLKNINNKKRTR